jgi:hypothetical protein
VVKKPIEQCRGHHRVAKHVTPFGEVQLPIFLCNLDPFDYFFTFPWNYEEFAIYAKRGTHDPVRA